MHVPTLMGIHIQTSYIPNKIRRRRKECKEEEVPSSTSEDNIILIPPRAKIRQVCFNILHYFHFQT